ncbi:MAG: glucosaminidase domain-containing protein [Prevotella sp.]|nr:glucosaminidase domain-containing protein [Prevotella sp.]
MKRYIFAVFLLFIMLVSADAQSIKWNKSYSDYFSMWGEVAVQQMVQYRIPASITLAQGVLESGAGKSELARKANNHFGIKCNGWTGRKSYHDDDERGECFRAYDNAYQSYVDHSVFLTNSPRYRRLFDLKRTDYKGWAKGLKACGYATSPTYATRLIEIIETYGLHRYDVGKGFDKQRIEQMHQSADQRQVFTFNSNYYVRARRGDTFRRIADDVDVSYRRLAKFNERDKNDTLEEGEIIWLQKKRRKAPKEFKNRPHRVEPGESMYIISQRYGIRLKNLYKMNGLTPDYVIQAGDLLRVR